jgi:hypothetical protein
MSTFEWVLVVLFVLISAFLAYQVWWFRTNALAITPSPASPYAYVITNQTAESISIGRVMVCVVGESGPEPLDEPPAVTGIVLPGPLAPQASFEVRFSSARQIAEIVYSRDFTVQVVAPDGTVLKILKARIAGPEEAGKAGDTDGA